MRTPVQSADRWGRGTLTPQVRRGLNDVLPGEGTPPTVATTRRLKARAPLRGFTLIELLVAASITAVLAAFMAVIVSNVTGVWSRTSGRLSTDAQARLILDQLALDLQGARYADDGRVWLAATVLANTTNAGALWDTRNATASALKPATVTGPQPLPTYNAAKISDATFGQAGVWLRFFTTRRGAFTTTAGTVSTDPTIVSAPVAVGWQIIRRASSPNTIAANTDRRYFLHRAEVRPAQTGTRPGTFESGYVINAAAYTTGGGANNNGATTGDPRSVQIPGSTTNLDAVIGENVIDFGVRCYVHNATNGGLTTVFPATATDTTHLASTPPRVGGPTTQFPEVVDVMVRILDDEGARLIADFEANPQRITRPVGDTSIPSDAAYWWRLALTHSQVFTRRIVIRAQPL